MLSAATREDDSAFPPKTETKTGLYQSSLSVDRGSSVIVNHSFLLKLRDLKEFEYVWPPISGQILWSCGGRDDFGPV